MLSIIQDVTLTSKNMKIVGLGFLPRQISYSFFLTHGHTCTRLIVWHVLLIISTHHFLGMSLVLSMIWAISCKVWFFLCTTPFCCGLYGTRNLCKTPYLLQKWHKQHFHILFHDHSKFLLFGQYYNIFSFFNLTHNFLKASKVSNFSVKKVYLQKSSIHTNM